MQRLAVLRFGGFEIRLRERLLLADGQPLVLGDRAFELLLVLARRRGELVRKHELLEQVWPGRMVEEHKLPVQVRALRQWLGDGAIATAPGYGYSLAQALLQQAAPGLARDPRLAEGPERIRACMQRALESLVGAEVWPARVRSGAALGVTEVDALLFAGLDPAPAPSARP